LKLLSNRAVAILIAVVVVFSATLFGVYKTADKQTREIEAMFFDGVYRADWGARQASAYSHLVNMANAALGLAVILEKYPELSEFAEDFLSLRRDFLATESIDEMLTLRIHMWHLSRVIFSLDEEIAVFVTEKDFSDIAQYVDTITGAWYSSDAGYSGKVEEYLESRSNIISLLSLVFPIRQPEVCTYDGWVLF